MTASGDDTFKSVISASERERFISSIAEKRPRLDAHASDHHSFILRVHEVIRGPTDQLVLDAIGAMIRPFGPNENLQLIFSSSEGQYSLQAKVVRLEPSTPGRVLIELGSQIHRLQRRNHFRVPVIPDVKIRFELVAMGGQRLAKPIEIAMADLSTSGMRLKWPIALDLKPTPAQSLEGTLFLSGEREFRVTGLIRNVFGVETEHVPVGVQFLTMSGELEQALLFSCMQIFRALSSAKHM